MSLKVSLGSSYEVKRYELSRSEKTIFDDCDNIPHYTFSSLFSSVTLFVFMSNGNYSVDCVPKDV